MSAFARIIILVSAVATALPAAPTRSQRIRHIDVTHLALDLRVNLRARTTAGSARITFVPLRPLEQITLDAGRLRIDSVHGPSGARLPFDYDGSDRDDALAVHLTRLVPAAETLAVTVFYAATHRNRSDPMALGGSNGEGLRYFGPTSTEPHKRRQLWSMGGVRGNRYWFPGHDAPGDLRTTEIAITVDDSLVAIANGRGDTPTRHSDGTRTYRYRMDRPYANAQTAIVVGDYVPVVSHYDGVTFTSLSYPDEYAAARASVVRLTDMARFLTDKTGQRFPFPSYTQVFVQDMPWGVANASLSTMTENMVDDEPTHAEYFYLWDGLEMEALAGQWFGGLVSARDTRHLWLERGLAHYMDALYSAERNSEGDALLWTLRGDVNAYLGGWQAGNREAVVPRDATVPDSFSVGGTPYNKGALVLHMLRVHLGDRTWWATIRRFLRDNAGTPVTTAEFQRAAELESGQSLDWFFTQWVTGVGHPRFDVSTTFDAAGRRQVVRVRQTQGREGAVPGSDSSYFRGTLRIGMDDTVHTVWLDAIADNVFAFPLDGAARRVTFDHDGAWIKELSFTKSIDDLAHQARTDPSVTGVHWALGQLFARASADSCAPADSRRIHAVLRDVIDGTAHWRVRYTALLQLSGLLGGADRARTVTLDSVTTATLQRVLARDSSWVKAAAVSLLGATRDTDFVPTYLSLLRDRFHTVSYAAAGALGRTRSARAYPALVALARVPSWKGENRLSALLGLLELGDRRAAAVALSAIKDQTEPRWYLAVSRWDYRIAAMETLVALGRGAEAVPTILARLDRAVAEDDINDVFSNVLLLSLSGDPRGAALFQRLRVRYAGDALALSALAQYEEQYQRVAPQRRPS